MRWFLVFYFNLHNDSNFETKIGKESRIYRKTLSRLPTSTSYVWRSHDEGFGGISEENWLRAPYSEGIEDDDVVDCGPKTCPFYNIGLSVGRAKSQL